MVRLRLLSSALPSSALPSSALLALVALAAMSVTACYKTPEPECAFACEFGADESCPSGYTCRADNMCKREGVADGFACPDLPGVDAAVVDGADIDGADVDAAEIDASTPDAATDAATPDAATPDASPDAAPDAATDAAPDASPAMLAIQTTSPLDFGTQTATTMQTVMVINNGMIATSAISLGITGDTEFALVAGGSDTCSTVTLGGGNTCSFQVSFTPPGGAASYSATVTVTAATGGAPTIMLTGMGQ